ncbi:hypothetical protein N0V90_009774 [Kalmusia sp. IMI 367209]|nr:hypothetical protein N0V90_009774 [Kalmusia sp. IMI 367209]
MKITVTLPLGVAAISAVLAAPTGQELAVSTIQEDVFFLSVHLPPSFGLENFTIHPPSKPVLFSLEKMDSTTNVYALYGADNGSGETRFITQYILPEEDNLTAIGWTPSSSYNGCPAEASWCDSQHWVVTTEASTLQINSRKGGWDAMKTHEGRGWHILWKDDADHIYHRLRITIVQSWIE